MSTLSQPSPRANHKFSERCGAHVFAEALQRHGVKYLFGQSIPSALHLVAPDYGMRQVAYRTENAGAVMADGFARMSNQVPVVTAQNGPAATLLVPGLAEALKASIPIVAIVQDVHRKFTDRNAFQELDHIALFQGSAKWIRRISEITRINDYVDMAFAAAASGRPGPAVLIAPIDLFEEAVGTSHSVIDRKRATNLGTFPLDRFGADRAQVEKAAALIAAAERPIVIAGGGVHGSQACDALVALQEKASLPVGTTAMGKGTVSEDHPLSLGVVGYFMGKRGMARYHRQLVAKADVVVLVGNRTNQNGTDSWGLYPPGATYIHIDIDGQEVGRNYDALRLVGDARPTLEALTKALSRENLSKRHAARAGIEAKIAEGREKHRAEAVEMTHSDQSPIRPERLMSEIDNHLTEDCVVVADASFASIWITNFLKARVAGQRFLSPRGLAGLGWGLPMAMGAHVADPSRPIYCVVGDGGFGHVWSELETARRMDMKLILFVLNNSILGYQEHAEDLFFGDHTDACRFVAVDHAAIARAVGCAGIRVENPADLAAAIEKAKAHSGLTLIDVITDDRAFPPVTAFDEKY